MQAIPMSPRRLKLAHAIRRIKMWRLAKLAAKRHHYVRPTRGEVLAMLAIYVLAIAYAAVAAGWLQGIESWGMWR